MSKRLHLSTRHTCRVLMNLDFSQNIFKKSLKYKVSSKSVQWGPELFDADVRIVAFRNFANGSKKVNG